MTAQGGSPNYIQQCLPREGSRASCAADSGLPKTSPDGAEVTTTGVVRRRPDGAREDLSAYASAAFRRRSR